ncbi:MAG: hypothetical protein Q8T09_01775 [Candidatus Melainabacteria bacterium]|nr:hypothetical protein [Candidatus Melainabacteria bacterium]
MEKSDSQIAKDVAGHLLDGKACKLIDEVGSMPVEQQLAVLKQATAFANSELGREKFNVTKSAYRDGLWWGDTIDVTVNQSNFLFFSSEIFGSSHKLDPARITNKCSEK